MIMKVGTADFYAIVETEIDKRFGRTPTSVKVRRCGLIPSTKALPIQTQYQSRDEKLMAFIRDLGASEEYIAHVQNTSLFEALQISNVIQSRGTNVDIDAVYFGVMLHDIGRLKSNAADHALIGAELFNTHRKDFKQLFSLMPDTIAKIVESIECHILGGLKKEWIEAAKLNIPTKDYIPESLEAKIVAFCDQILHNRTQQPIIFKEAPSYDIEVYKQYYVLTTDMVNALFLKDEPPVPLKLTTIAKIQNEHWFCSQKFCK